MDDEYDYQDRGPKTSTRVKGAIAGLLVGLIVVFGFSFVGTRRHQTNYHTRASKRYVSVSWYYYALGGFAFASYGFVKPNQITDFIKRYMGGNRKGF